MKLWIATLLLFTLLAGCSSAPSTPPPAAAKPPDETGALEAIAKTNEAQAIYFKRNRRYALEFSELVDSKDLKAEPSAADLGYDFTLRPAPDAQTYTLSVKPVTPSPTVHYFFTDPSGIVRAESGREATAQSPVFPK